jgi:hypothetical protein
MLSISINNLEIPSLFNIFAPKLIEKFFLLIAASLLDLINFS